MTQADSSAPRSVAVSETPIELCQFMKFGGLAESGGQAKHVISQGLVLLNGAPETRKRKKLVVGDNVTYAGRTITVSQSAP